jgi:hypothetical protein
MRMTSGKKQKEVNERQGIRNRKKMKENNMVDKRNWLKKIQEQKQRRRIAGRKQHRKIYIYIYNLNVQKICSIFMFLHVPLTLYSIAANCYAAYY